MNVLRPSSVAITALTIMLGASVGLAQQHTSMQGPTAASTPSTSARSKDSGFSQKMALPAFAARMDSSAWVSVLEQITTASTAGSARMLS